MYKRQDAGSATPFIIGTNDTIDGLNSAFWTPDNNAHGTIEAFTVRGIDSDAELSGTQEIIKLTVNAINDVPVLAGYSSPFVTTDEDVSVTLTLADLQAGSDDIEDKMLHAALVQNVFSGSLFIGPDRASAVEYDPISNNTIDAANTAYLSLIHI